MIFASVVIVFFFVHYVVVVSVGFAGKIMENNFFVFIYFLISFALNAQCFLLYQLNQIKRWVIDVMDDNLNNSRRTVTVILLFTFVNENGLRPLSFVTNCSIQSCFFLNVLSHSDFLRSTIDTVTSYCWLWWDYEPFKLLLWLMSCRFFLFEMFVPNTKQMNHSVIL